MPTLTPQQAPVQHYYQRLNELRQTGSTHEMAIREPMSILLRHCSEQRSWQFTSEKRISGQQQRPDATISISKNFLELYWEAKDEQDDLNTAIQEKFDNGYPQRSILFSTPALAVLFDQDGNRSSYTIGPNSDKNQDLCDVLNRFFEIGETRSQTWKAEAQKFQEKLPQLSQDLKNIIHQARAKDNHFQICFKNFTEQMRQAINPNISENALEEMLIQHLLTEDIFKAVFDDPQTLKQNQIAVQLEDMVRVLTRKFINRDQFFAGIQPYFNRLTLEARNRPNTQNRLFFLHGIYQRFFQDFSTKTADTHGIVYTPQPIVDFMVEAADATLKNQLGKKEGLGAEGVHILDPFCGTGHFIRSVMERLTPQQLRRKYFCELHANEVMLLPYYITSLQAELYYYEKIGQYQPFPGICLVDTFDIGKEEQLDLPASFTEQNTKRIQNQQESNIMVILSNPPYNSRQMNENDNNRNRLYPRIDGRIRETYAKDSTATSKISLYDPYVRALRWASDRISQKQDKRGLVCLVTNNGFLETYAADGLRKHLRADYDQVHIVDLGGNARKATLNPGKLSNVFGIQVGVSINLLTKYSAPKKENGDSPADLHYQLAPETGKATDKLAWLSAQQQTVQQQGMQQLDWTPITPDAQHTWLNQGHPLFPQLPAIGDKDAKPKPRTQNKRKSGKSLQRSKKEKRRREVKAKAIFWEYSLGVKTNRDAWCWNSSPKALSHNMERTINFYNDQVGRWLVALKQQQQQQEQQEKQKDKIPNPKDDKAAFTRYLDDFVHYDDQQLSWDGSLKINLARTQLAKFEPSKLRRGLYRPFVKRHLYFDRMMNARVYRQPSFFPVADSPNRVICTSGVAGRRGFSVLITDCIPNISLVIEGVQCFPQYTYKEYGTGQAENLTDWGLKQYQERYGQQVTKQQVFYYVYAVLQHPAWCQAFQHDLRRALPRIAWAADPQGFSTLAQLGEQLAELHLGYETADEYDLTETWKNDQAGSSYLVGKQKMRFVDTDKTILRFNDQLTLHNIPPQAHQWQLEGRSALEWLADQLVIKTDKASGLVNDPNDPQDHRACLRLIKQVCYVALETAKCLDAIKQVRLEGIDLEGIDLEGMDKD